MTKAEINQRVRNAINSHDARKTAEFYSENAVVYSPVYPETLRGRKSIEKDSEGTFHEIIEEHRYYNVVDMLGCPGLVHY